MIVIKLYLVFINLVSGIVFAYDKFASKNKRRRIPEYILHLLELAGGVFAICILTYTLKHKSKKFNYKIWTWLMLIWWLAACFIMYKYF